MRYAMDTTAFSTVMRRDPALISLIRGHQPRDIVTVPPVVAEIHYGLERMDKSSKKYLILKSERDRWLSVISVLPWSPESSEQFGKIKANLEQRGQLIDDFDIAIAAIAKAHHCGVLTANMRHFRRIKNLKCKSWTGGGDKVNN